MTKREAAVSAEESLEERLIKRAFSIHREYTAAGTPVPDKILTDIQGEARTFPRKEYNEFRREVGSVGLQGLMADAAPSIVRILFGDADGERFNDVILLSRILGVTLRGYTVTSMLRIAWDFEARVREAPSTIDSDARAAHKRLEYFLREHAGGDIGERYAMRDHLRMVGRTEPDAIKAFQMRSRDDAVREYRDACFMRAFLFLRLQNSTTNPGALDSATKLVREILSLDARARELLKEVKAKKKRTNPINATEAMVRRSALISAAKILRDDAEGMGPESRAQLVGRAEMYEAEAKAIIDAEETLS